MLSLASILNPEPPRQTVTTGSHLYSPPGSSSPEFPFLGRSPLAVKPPMAEDHRMPKDLPGLPKSKVKGTVKFYPFEDLDEESLREVRRFRVTPFGGIRNNCRHIPYNSGKKDFFEKTGRESFEVFQYTFKLPNDETEYAVMWDYNVGLVRMTPFFKCCNYPKTTPAKMLNMNPGLRDITHSITGGCIMAQGYWMPFSCAKAVCATFCHHISGALIPIFGPQFPSECVHPDAPDHGRMCIDPAIVAEATVEAEDFRRLYAEQASAMAGVSVSVSPRQTQQQRRNNNNNSNTQLNRTHRPPYNTTCSPYQNHNPPFGGSNLPDSPYGTDTEDYYDGYSGPENTEADLGLYHYHQNNNSHYPYTTVPSYRAVHTAPTSSGWTAANKQPHPHPRYQASDRHLFHPSLSSRDGQQRYDNHRPTNPILSALPRPSAPVAEQGQGQTPQSSPSSSSQQPRRFLPAVMPRHCTTPAAHHILSGTSHYSHPAVAPPTPVMSPKRPRGVAFESTTSEADNDHDGGSQAGSNSGSPTASRLGVEGEYRLTRHHHQQSRSDNMSQLHLPPISVVSSVAATVAERNAALLLMNLSVVDGRGDRGGQKDDDDDDGRKETEEKEKDKGGVGSVVPWASLFFNKAAVRGRPETATCRAELELEPPAKKKRRTISI